MMRIMEWWIFLIFLFLWWMKLITVLGTMRWPKFVTNISQKIWILTSLGLRQAPATGLRLSGKYVKDRGLENTYQKLRRRDAERISLRAGSQRDNSNQFLKR